VLLHLYHVNLIALLIMMMMMMTTTFMIMVMTVRGPDWDTHMEGRSGCRVRDLLTELYDKAGHAKQWWLVRHTAGMLRKKVEDLAKAATDIIVRQKQLAVGLPPEPREKIITRSVCA